MPYIVTGEPSSPKPDYSRMNFDYEYPDGLDLKPGSKLHDNLRSKIWTRARESRNEISKRFPSWREIDKNLTTYIPLKDKEEKLKKKDSTKPVSIVFPYSYAELEALLTYMSMAFFQDPIWRYEGVDDEDTIGGMLLELTIKLQCIKSKVPLALHTVFRDNFAYGIGAGIPTWITRTGKVPRKSTIVTESELGKSSENLINFVEDTIFEGNSLDNIDPYMWLPDPTVSSVNIQDGEYVGWIDRDNYMNMLSDESRNGSNIFNVKYLKEKKDKKSSLSNDESERQLKFGGSTDARRGMSQSTNPVDNIKMYVNLIPKDWKLGPGEYPEKWFFCLSADDIITQCERADHNHGLYPIAVASSEYDGYSITPIARMEILNGLQTTLDFLFNSHVANVRKAINDMLIVDPYLVNIEDLKSPEPGKLIRLRRPAWGRGVDKVVQQLAVKDITRANIADAGFVMSMMDKISGADPSMQGSLRMGGPERLTRSEFQGTRGSAVSRLQRIAMIIGQQFMQDIGTMFAVHTQQYMRKETYVKIAGPYEQQLMKQFGKDKTRIRVSPMDIAINYDLIVRDGSIPGGNFSEAWLEMFKVIGTTPALNQEFDIVRIFMYIAQQLGAKNVEDFRRNVNQVQPTVMPDQEVQNQVQAGNMVPLGA
uniref:Portal protein n=2 Tax=viral metagenome TaxID=1070528 RepID=A0A6H1ZML8_9ZZZZ